MAEMKVTEKRVARPEPILKETAQLKHVVEKAAWLEHAREEASPVNVAKKRPRSFKKSGEVPEKLN